MQLQAGIAQSVEHFTRNEGVEGSSPFSSFKEKTPQSQGILRISRGCGVFVYSILKERFVKMELNLLRFAEKK